jgi:hypothetical protein
MSTLPKALRLADALEELDAQFSHTGLCGEAAAELRRLHEALETEQEPVAWYDSLSGWTDFGPYRPHRKPSSPSAEWIPLYASPPKKELTCVCGAVWEGERMVHAPIQQEPVAWMYEWDSRKHLTFTDQRFVEQAHPHFNKSTPLYTAPPKKQWVSLTDQEVWQAIDNVLEGGGWLDVARVLEQAFKEKNT